MTRLLRSNLIFFYIFKSREFSYGEDLINFKILGEFLTRADLTDDFLQKIIDVKIDKIQ